MLRRMGSINYFDTFIAVAEDSTALQGMVPGGRAKPTVAELAHTMITANPYTYTSDDVVFTIYADRNGIPESERLQARQAFFAKSQACLRASDLGKKFGWGIHCDTDGRVALYGVESDEYRQFLSGEGAAGGGEAVMVRKAMRSRRG